MDPDGFEELVSRALDDVPPDFERHLANIAILVEDEPPPGQPLLGLYVGVPLTRRSALAPWELPDRITIFRGPIERLCGGDPECVEREVRRVVLHEIAHHFGISDERLMEIDRY